MARAKEQVACHTNKQLESSC
uniref:Uncharacterized protein n=1 Tax=Anguilla anguilla TaxID=7936 RepID=A0A0E9V6A3_ANGAN